MTLSTEVSISGRFIRSVRIDQDTDASSIEGYVFSNSLKNLLLGMGEQQKESGQGAFTWTGPYGSGKSSLALALSSLLSGTKQRRDVAANIIGEDFSNDLWALLPPQTKGWKCLSLIGRRDEPHQIIANALASSDLLKTAPPTTSEEVIDVLLSIANATPKSSGGLIVIIDEMGKFLESAALSDGDVYFFQLLAEAASRSNGRLIVIGILHQAFQEYASRIARDTRDEWSKIQGRFTDISVNISSEEQVELISQAIEHSSVPNSAVTTAKRTASLIRKNLPALGHSIESALANAWPLNPITTTLLGPISRRSYGQNQRSIFSFLGSSEAMGFQDFLRQTKASSKKTFLPENLWDYLIFNLESSIAVSTDSHQFSAAKDALARCQKSGDNHLETSIIKTIALLELTQQKTGLGADIEALNLSLPHATKKEIVAAIQSLESKSIIIFKKFRGVYALFEGSDFDIEGALNTANREISSIDLNSVSKALAVSSISAKRHYHQTGSLRWCDLRVIPVNQLEAIAKTFTKESGAFGLFALALPTNNENAATIEKAINVAQSKAKSFDFVIATSDQAKNLLAHAKDRTALAHILKNNRDIQRDKIARREISDRLEAVSHLIEQEVWLLLNGADWHIDSKDTRQLTWTGINALASTLADKRFDKSPRIHNELLNRMKPSGTANGALKLLLHAMVLREGQRGLGFTKYPAEKGLFVSLVEHNNLYQEIDGKWQFVAPEKDNNANLHPLWKAAREYLKKNEKRSIQLEEIYDLWRAAPYGVKDGVLPLLGVLFMMTERSNLAYYREGIFLSTITDIDIDYLLKASNIIQIRWMNMSNIARKLLANMADVAAELTGQPVLDLEPLDVGRALIAAYETAPPWVHRTSRLSKNAQAIRTLFKRSNDPNKFIFDDIPALYADQTDITTGDGIEFISDQIRQGLKDILEAYELMLHGLREQVLEELQVHSRSTQAYTELNERAANIKGISGNLRLEAFINRATMLNDSTEEMESLAGLAINKPAKSWIDGDLDRAAVELINFAQQFNKHETVARVKGRKDKREAMAVVVGLDGRPQPYMHEFDVMENDKEKVTTLATEIKKLIDVSKKGADQTIQLAALASVSAMIIGEQNKPEQEEDRDHA
ncbi:hypothetical protein [Kordiimonas aquimaris]|uniref:hypothetical protein n=1 Tax=Kordiimonas aquimaris TaxID=707591 RepID=UPI0021D097F5|nr:hypothetical protein [Kordiimonas aquimaris]